MALCGILSIMVGYAKKKVEGLLNGDVVAAMML
jgi:hypothetical protein